MPLIRDAVERFAEDTRYTERDHGTALDWMSYARCGNKKTHVLSDPVGSLSEEDKGCRKKIRDETIRFIRRHFDDRPEVVLSLDRLFAELVTTDESDRRKEFLPFDNIYDPDEFKVLLLKHLQPTADRERHTRTDIAQYFLTSDKTVNTYISMMAPMRDREAGDKVLGQVVEVSPARGTNVPESTTHPVFLPLNMVELYTLVDALVGHTHDQVEGRIIRSVLNRLYDQTTQYARERLSRIEGFDDALAPVRVPDDKEDLGEDVIFNEKERIQATVRYEAGGEERTCSGYISRKRQKKAYVTVRSGNGVLRIPYDSIIELKSLRK